MKVRFCPSCLSNPSQDVTIGCNLKNYVFFQAHYKGLSSVCDICLVRISFSVYFYYLIDFLPANFLFNLNYVITQGHISMHVCDKWKILNLAIGWSLFLTKIYGVLIHQHRAGAWFFIFFWWRKTNYRSCSCFPWPASNLPRSKPQLGLIIKTAILFIYL